MKYNPQKPMRATPRAHAADRLRRTLFASLLVAVGMMLVLPQRVWGSRAVVAEGHAESADLAAITVAAQSSLTDVASTVLAEAQRVDFPFTSIAARWPVPLTEAPGSRLEVRTRSQRSAAWSPWRALEPLRDTPHALARDVVETELLFVPSAGALQYRYVGTVGATTIQNLDAVTFVYLGTQPRPVTFGTFLRSLLAPARAESTLPVVDRASWGADESYRLADDGSERWPTTYAAPQKFIVHHTVTGDGATDATAVLQQIYYYHANVVEGDGWGDIGYNYLIDANGVIYEGRSGGDGVVGGHTYNSATKTNYNVGSVGIALLGNYETGVPTQATLTSLATLIAQKSQLFGITPTGTSFFLTGTYPNIVGHNDVDATLCPGKNTKAHFDAVRTEAQSIFDALPPLAQQTFSAELVSPATAAVTVQSGSTTTYEATYRNTGSAPWQSYIAARRVALMPVDGTETVKIQSGWVSAQEVGTSAAANVQPAATGTFRVTIAAPTDTLDVVQTFALRAPDGTEIPKTRFTLTVSATGVAYAAAITAGPPVTSFANETRRVTVRVENRGTSTWKQGEVLLRLSDDDGTTSAFKAASWQSADASIVADQPTVATGETATFTFDLHAPKTPGVYRHALRVVRNDGSAIVTDPLVTDTRVDSHWQAALMEKKAPAAVQRGWRPTITLRFKNTGLATWNRGLLLRVYDDRGKATALRNPAWRRATGDAILKERSVLPGALGTFMLRLKAPSKRGTHRVQFLLELKNGKEVVQHERIIVPIRVD